MADVYGKDVSGYKYHVLYRIINCLDCSYPDFEKDANTKLVTLYYSALPINKEIRHCIKLLEKKKNMNLN